MRIDANKCVDMRITVIVTDEEYAEIRRKAGLVPLSAWIRSMVLEDNGKRKATVQAMAAHAPTRPVKAGKRETTQPAGEVGKCPHRKMTGEVCYKCDPKFGYPEIA